MDFKNVQAQLKSLRDRIKNKGEISPADEKELKSLIRQTLETANDELEGIRGRLDNLVKTHQANDNKILSEEQKSRLKLVEKTGTGSIAVH
ncbi:MAG: hypothetical protein AAF569_01465 [Pseudomonadota bacterium]